MNPWENVRSVRLGEYAVARDEGRLGALGLGSCVAVMLFDPVVSVGGLAHVVLPIQSMARDRANSAKFGETAVPFLIGEMMRLGADPKNTRAYLVGGACMFSALIPKDQVHMGQRNVDACRQALGEMGVPIVNDEVGGEKGRSVVLDVSSGRITVRSMGTEERQL